MTFLQLINKVLVGLREDTVLGVTANEVKLIAQFVNEAKEEIEDMGPWYALRTTLSGSTAASTETVDFTASTNERSYILTDGATGQPLVWITNSGQETRLIEMPYESMEDLYNSDASPDPGKPAYYSVLPSADGLVLRFWPLPDGVYTIKVRAVVPQAELTATTDELTIAAAPVWKLALAKAMDERGSEFGGNGGAEMKSRKAIADYILRDFGSDPMTFRAV